MKRFTFERRGRDWWAKTKGFDTPLCSRGPRRYFGFPRGVDKFDIVLTKTRVENAYEFNTARNSIFLDGGYRPYLGPHMVRAAERLRKQGYKYVHLEY